MMLQAIWTIKQYWTHTHTLPAANVKLMQSAKSPVLLNNINGVDTGLQKEFNRKGD